MGIIKATVTAVRGAASDQWKEAFCAGEMGNDLLMARAKKLTGQNSSNNGMGEVITDGSTILVGEGECAIATEGGKVIGIYDEPGEQIFRSQQSRGIFGGGLGAFMKDVGRRISFGGSALQSLPVSDCLPSTFCRLSNRHDPAQAQQAHCPYAA